MINGRNFFDQLVKNIRNIRKIVSGQEDGYTVGRLLHFLYYKRYYKMITRNT